MVTNYRGMEFTVAILLVLRFPGGFSGGMWMTDLNVGNYIGHISILLIWSSVSLLLKHKEIQSSCCDVGLVLHHQIKLYQCRCILEQINS